MAGIRALVFGVSLLSLAASGVPAGPQASRRMRGRSASAPTPISSR